MEPSLILVWDGLRAELLVMSANGSHTASRSARYVFIDPNLRTIDQINNVVCIYCRCLPYLQTLYPSKIIREKL